MPFRRPYLNLPVMRPVPVLVRVALLLAAGVGLIYASGSLSGNPAQPRVVALEPETVQVAAPSVEETERPRTRPSSSPSALPVASPDFDPDASLGPIDNISDEAPILPMPMPNSEPGDLAMTLSELQVQPTRNVEGQTTDGTLVSVQLELTSSVDTRLAPFQIALIIDDGDGGTIQIGAQPHPDLAPFLGLVDLPADEPVRGWLTFLVPAGTHEGELVVRSAPETPYQAQIEVEW